MALSWIKSIRFVAVASIASALLLALVTSSISLSLSRASTLDASAINLAGSLRMQSYRLATAILTADQTSGQLQTLIDKFDATLSHLARNRPEVDDPDSRSSQRFAHIDQRWHEQMRPALTEAALHARYLAEVKTFVDDVDAFVVALQVESEARNYSLRYSSRYTLGVAVVLAILILLAVRRQLIVPLSQMVEAVQKFRRGQFDTRVEEPSSAELRALAVAFNNMGASLQLEHQQRELLIEHQQRSLALLYHTSQLPQSEQLSKRDCQVIFDELSQLAGAEGCALYLSSSAHKEWLSCYSGSQGYDDSLPEQVAVSVLRAKAHLHLFELRVQDSLFGYLAVQHSQPLRDDDVQCVETLASLLAGQFAQNARRIQERRVALAEERSVIARELHDSIAQTLSFMKIQVVRLLKADPDQREPIIHELRGGIDNAYLHVRELISSFRLSLNGRSLILALGALREQLREEHAELSISLELPVEAERLTPNEEIHLYQLIREACLNGIQHGRASRLAISMTEAAQGVCVCVSDNGQGFAPDVKLQGHFGLGIMKERARMLGGDLQIDSSPGQGTQVSLTFTPAYLEQERQ